MLLSSYASLIYGLCKELVLNKECAHFLRVTVYKHKNQYFFLRDVFLKNKIYYMIHVAQYLLKDLSYNDISKYHH